MSLDSSFPHSRIDICLVVPLILVYMMVVSIYWKLLAATVMLHVSRKACCRYIRRNIMPLMMFLYCIESLSI